ncbi:hypothetical protein [Hugenholtzia roseola]|uniref:hypothetical protein n=1 Tax=Hugenholtzia roseola TaxID=1002 RepID=UPI0004015DC7|nr:hypothetical protein [Hugenholtzia roseola]
MKKTFVFGATFGKKIALSAAFIALVSFSNLAEASQPKQTKGYWVVESNLNQKDKTIIRFYNQDNEFLQEQILEGKHLELDANTVKILNQSLELYLKSQAKLKNLSEKA